MAASTDSRANVMLPTELFGLIVAKLSLLHLFQLRLVCKHWNAMLHDMEFLEEHFQLTKRAPVYVWRTQEGYAAYSPESNSWQMWPAPFFLMEKSWYKISAGANGLLLVDSEVDSKVTFYVGNPMTRSYRKLSEVQHGRSTNKLVTRSDGRLLYDGYLWATRMIFDEGSTSYKIFGEKSGEFLAPHPNLNRRHPIRSSTYAVYMYDIEHDSWKLYDGWGDPLIYAGVPTFYQGILHCLLTAYGYECFGFYRRFHDVHHFKNGTNFCQLIAEHEPENMLFVHMFQWQGNLLFVGGKRIDEHSVSSLEFWQLDEEKHAWMETITMPHDILLRFSPPDPNLHLQFSCNNSAEYVYFTSYSEDSMFARHFVFNLSKTL